MYFAFCAPQARDAAAAMNVAALSRAWNSTLVFVVSNDSSGPLRASAATALAGAHNPGRDPAHASKWGIQWLHQGRNLMYSGVPRTRGFRVSSRWQRFLLRPLVTDMRNFADQTGRFRPGISMIATWRNFLSELHTARAVALPKPFGRRAGACCLPSFPRFCRVSTLDPVSPLASIGAFAHHDSGLLSGLGRGAIRNLFAVAIPRHQGAPLAAVGAPTLSRPLRTRFP